jgi:diacylglycerol kinase family enzyme
MTSFSSTTKADAVIVNPRAGALMRDPELLRWIVGRQGPTCEVFVTESRAELDDVVRRIVAKPRRLVSICGGDGTYHAVATSLFNVSPDGPYPPLALVRAGTVGTIARNWGSPRAPEKALAALLGAGDSLQFAHRPSLRIDDGGRPLIGFIFGTGLVSRFFDEYERRGAGGNRTALSIAARVFAESLTGGPLSSRVLSPLPCRLEVDGQELPSKAFSLIVAAVIRDLGLHFQVTHRAGEDPARPHLVASALPPRLLAPQWPLVFLGRRLLGPGGFDGLIHRFTVTFAEPESYVLDGDTLRARTVAVSAGPTLRVATVRRAR